MKWALFRSLLSLGLLGGCAADLGEPNCTSGLRCNVSAEGVQTPFPSSNEFRFEGQALINDRCANGVCHSSDAQGSARRGAPAELDFDLDPVHTPLCSGGACDEDAEVAREVAVLEATQYRVFDWRDSIWGEIDSDRMPPSGSPGLSVEEKESIRNWLAWGGPTVKTTILASNSRNAGESCNSDPADYNCIQRFSPADIEEVLKLDGDVTSGFNTFIDSTSTCLNCHAKDGTDGGVAPDITGTKDSEPRALATSIIDGVEGTQMGGYGLKLSEKNIADIIAWIKAGFPQS